MEAPPDSRGCTSPRGRRRRPPTRRPPRRRAGTRFTWTDRSTVRRSARWASGRRAGSRRRRDGRPDHLRRARRRRVHRRLPPGLPRGDRPAGGAAGATPWRWPARRSRCWCARRTHRCPRSTRPASWPPRRCAKRSPGTTAHARGDDPGGRGHPQRQARRRPGPPPLSSARGAGQTSRTPPRRSDEDFARTPVERRAATDAAWATRPLSHRGDGESACKRDSVVARATGGHPSVRPTRRLLPGGADGPPVPPARPCSGRGLPSRPGHPGRWCALTAPFHPHLWPVARPIGGLSLLH